MLPHPHRFLCALVVLTLAIALGPARADDAEGVKKKLADAKKTYTNEAEKAKKAIGELLDKREAEARKAGNKKLLDQVKAERTAFEEQNELPADCPKALLTRMKTARTNLDAAFAAAVKSFVRLKDDAAAAATEQEQQLFLLASAFSFGKRTYLVTLNHSDVLPDNNAFSNNGQVGSHKLKLNGELAPHSILLHPPVKGASQVKYTLGGTSTAFRATVGVPKLEEEAGNPGSPLTFEVLGDGKSLWKSEPVTKVDTFQKCEVNVTKVKVLTLLVHCPEANFWARAVWFEPLLAE
jgi:hypothetical protein